MGNGVLAHHLRSTFEQIVSRDRLSFGGGHLTGRHIVAGRDCPHHVHVRHQTPSTKRTTMAEVADGNDVHSMVSHGTRDLGEWRVGRATHDARVHAIADA